MINRCMTPHSLVELTDDAGTALTKDVSMNGMYVIAATGAQTKYFYIAWDATFAGEIIEIDYLVNTAVTFSFDLEERALGATNWQPMTAHANDLAADGSSQELNSNFPLRQIVPHGTYCRVKTVVGGACTIGVRVISV